MRSGFALLIVGLMITISGCSSLSVSQDYDTKYDFATLKTFGFMETPTDAGVSQLTVDRVVSATKSSLEYLGYTESDDPDFLVAMHGGQKTQTQIDSYGYGYGWGWGAGGVDVYQYQEGTLIIDIVDAKNKDLIWRGTGQDVVDPNADTQKRTETINNAVSKILAQFPPTTSSS